MALSLTREAQKRLIQSLYALARTENRGALAALRRGLTQQPGTALEMYPYVAPYVPAEATPWEEQMCYLVAALFAYHTEIDDREYRNIGHAFAELAARENTRPENASPSLTLRFNALLNSHPKDLHVHLRSAISLLRSKDIPVNWLQLLNDLCAWTHPEKRTQRRWAKAFWTASGTEQPQSEDAPAG